MTDIRAELEQLYVAHFGSAAAEVTPLAGAGSNRKYFRLTAPESARAEVPPSVIGTVGTDPLENRAFIALATHFAEKGLPAPRVLAATPSCMAYLQTDLGSLSLFDALAPARNRGAFSAEEEALVERAVRMLPHVQIEGARCLDFSACFPAPAMDGQMIANDLNYFKYCFLKSSGVEFSEQAIDGELRALASLLEADAAEATTFMVRDFQSRNVMIHNGSPYLIDFQGGRRGPMAYDLASFLWQAKARFPQPLRERMIDVYMSEAKSIDPAFNEERFRAALPRFVLFRMLQTLGAYGFRGWAEGKPHFLQSIPAGVDGLVELLTSPWFRSAAIGEGFAALAEVLGRVVASPKVEAIKELCSAEPFEGLTVTVSSFSYKKGHPTDLSGNGGGFLFDCRAVHNPGRYDEYKPLTGRDEPVIRFLEENGEIHTFLSHVYPLVDASVERYLSRGFNSLSIGFGCTGGRHRSVYSAEATAAHLAARYPQARILLHHREQHLMWQFHAGTKTTLHP